PVDPDRRIAIRTLSSMVRQDIVLGLPNTITAMRWAPDARTLAVQALDPPTKSTALWLIDRATAHRTVAAAPSAGTSLNLVRWSADGSTLYFTRVVPDTKTYTLIAHDLASGAQREVFVVGGAPTTPDFHVSPDGHTVYFRRTIGSAAPFTNYEF